MKNRYEMKQFLLGSVILATLIGCDTRNEFPVDDIADAPVLSITLDRDHLQLNDTLSITLEATSEVGLSAIWWFAEREDLGKFSLNHIYYCDSTKYELVTWQVVMDTVLHFRIGANARDILYGNGLPHQTSEGHGIPWVWVYVDSTEN